MARATTDDRARSDRASGYTRRKPEQGVLHQVVRDHLQTFVAQLEDSDDERGLPAFVRRELSSLVSCGVLAHGFARFRCPDCTAERLVAFSCKGRGFCPSCCGRRMVERAAHLVDHVLPRVPVRQWVLSLPHPLRYRMAFDHELCRAVLGCFVRAVQAHYRRRGKKRGLAAGRTGTVTVIQRAGGALNLNPHFHTLSLDGVFTENDDGTLRFRAARAPSDAEVEAVLRDTRTRVLKMLSRRGLLLADVDAVDADEDDAGLQLEAGDPPALSDVYAASVTHVTATGPRAGDKLVRLRNAAAIPQVKRRRRRHANLDGFDLHASAAVRKKERPRLERLCRYLLRPPVAQERLSWSAGKVLLKLKNPWRDGSTHIAFTPSQLLEKLAALVPRPLANQTLYHGVLAPNAKWRPRVVAFGRPDTDDEADSRTPKRSRTRHRRGNRTWAALMRRGLDLDVLECPRCSGRMKFVATLIEPRVVRRILDHLGLPSDPVTLAPARAPPDPTDREPGTHPRPAGLKLRGLPRCR